MHYFPGRKIDYPESEDERDEYEAQLSAEIEYIQNIEIQTLRSAIVRAFNGD
jgi:hypothetical protein